MLTSKVSASAQGDYLSTAYASDHFSKRRKLLQSSAGASTGWDTIGHNSVSAMNASMLLDQSRKPENGAMNHFSTFLNHSFTTNPPLNESSVDAMSLALGWIDVDSSQTTGNIAHEAIQQQAQLHAPGMGPGHNSQSSWLFSVETLSPGDLFDPSQPQPMYHSCEPDMFNIDSMVGDEMAWAGFSPKSNRQSSFSPASPRPRQEIPSERFARVQSLWPSPVKGLEFPVDLWKHVVASDRINITAGFAVPYEEPFQPVNSNEKFNYGFDHACRSRLVCDSRQSAPPASPPNSTTHDWQPSAFQAHRSSGVNNSTRNASDIRDTISPATFPSTAVLGSGLDLYFRRFHPLMPFIHPATFTASETSSVVLFPMCLIGFTFLDDIVASRFVSAQLPVCSPPSTSLQLTMVHTGRSRSTVAVPCLLRCPPVLRQVLKALHGFLLLWLQLCSTCA